METSTGFSLES